MKISDYLTVLCIRPTYDNSIMWVDIFYQGKSIYSYNYEFPNNLYIRQDIHTLTI